MRNTVLCDAVGWRRWLSERFAEPVVSGSIPALFVRWHGRDYTYLSSL